WPGGRSDRTSGRNTLIRAAGPAFGARAADRPLERAEQSLADDLTPPAREHGTVARAGHEPLHLAPGRQDLRRDTEFASDLLRELRELPDRFGRSGVRPASLRQRCQPVRQLRG